MLCEDKMEDILYFHVAYFEKCCEILCTTKQTYLIFYSKYMVQSLHWVSVYANKVKKNPLTNNLLTLTEESNVGIVTLYFVLVSNTNIPSLYVAPILWDMCTLRNSLCSAKTWRCK